MVKKEFFARNLTRTKNRLPSEVVKYSRLVCMYGFSTCVCTCTYTYTTCMYINIYITIFNTFCLQDTLSKVLHLLVSYFNCFFFWKYTRKRKVFTCIGLKILIPFSHQETFFQYQLHNLFAYFDCRNYIMLSEYQVLLRLVA